MKTKNIIKILTKANAWRRWKIEEMPDITEFWIAIDGAIEKLKQIDSYNSLFESMKQTKKALIKKLEKADEALNKACEKLVEVTKEKDFLNDLNNAWTWELKFEKLQKEHYKSMIDEVEVLLNKWVKPHLIKQVIKNWKERAVIDLSIHTDLLFK